MSEIIITSCKHQKRDIPPNFILNEETGKLEKNDIENLIDYSENKENFYKKFKEENFEKVSWEKKPLFYKVKLITEYLKDEDKIVL